MLPLPPRGEVGATSEGATAGEARGRLGQRHPGPHLVSEELFRDPSPFPIGALHFTYVMNVQKESRRWGRDQRERKRKREREEERTEDTWIICLFYVKK